MPFDRRSRKQAPPLTEQALYEYAVKALAGRMRTVAELNRLMRKKVEPGETGERKMAAVIARLKEQRYLDDAVFAATYARLRQENESFGKRRVLHELARKGIQRELLASTVETAYENLPEEELARRYLARKRIGKPQNPKETARLVRRLASAGFAIPVVIRILKNWDIEVNEEELTPPDSPSEDQAE